VGIDGPIGPPHLAGLVDQRADRRLEACWPGLHLNQQGKRSLRPAVRDYALERYGLKALPYLLGWPAGALAVEGVFAVNR